MFWSVGSATAAWQVAATIFTLRTFSAGLRCWPGFGRRIRGRARGLVGLVDRAGHFDRVTNVIASLPLDGLATSFSESPHGRGAGAALPDVPTALSNLHFRSESMNDSGVSPAFRHPVTVTSWRRPWHSCIGGSLRRRGGVCAESQRQTGRQRNFRQLPSSLDILLGYSERAEGPVFVVSSSGGPRALVGLLSTVCRNSAGCRAREQRRRVDRRKSRKTGPDAVELKLAPAADEF